jgi:hypothetical protein
VPSWQHLHRQPLNSHSPLPHASPPAPAAAETTAKTMMARLRLHEGSTG